jgi:NADPH:quinone reductase-like Zn-dependent oxidoreductase
MRAVLVSAHGDPPALAERLPPAASEGRALLELRAASLNPADIAIASGSFPAGSPPLPYVPGIEGVGTVLASGRFREGTRVWVSGRGLGVAYDGTFSERFSAVDETLVQVPDAAGDVLAAAVGVPGLAAWLPLTRLAPIRDGETVVVLGATGNVGTVAVQAAKLLGAGRVVAVGRDEERLSQLLRLGADAIVPLGSADLRDRLEAGSGDAPPTFVLDALWGEPLEATLTVVAPGARIVHVGQSAGATATIPSGLVRGKSLQIFGHTNFAVPQDVVAAGYAELLGHAAAGRIRIPVETIELADVSDAWTRQASGPDAKLVLVA